MARRHKFKDQAAYQKTQIELTAKKVRRGKANLSTSVHILETIIDTHTREVSRPIKQGLCHGVRLGQELDVFETLCPESKWYGTEINPDLCDGSRILNVDFKEVLSDWPGRFDVIYSNSLDHSDDPHATLKAWMSCLNPWGRIYLEWTKYHEKLGPGRNRADCFAAQLKEYIRMVYEIEGRLEGLLKLHDPPERKPKPLERTIIIFKKG